jgi:hypothetical protein
MLLTIVSLVKFQIKVLARLVQATYNEFRGGLLAGAGLA